MNTEILLYLMQTSILKCIYDKIILHIFEKVKRHGTVHNAVNHKELSHGKVHSVNEVGIWYRSVSAFMLQTLFQEDT